MGELGTQAAVAGIAGLFGLMPWLVQWLGSRSQDRRHATRVRHLKDELEFLEKLAALRSDPAAVQPAIARLAARYEALAEEHGDVQGAARGPSQYSRLRRALLAFPPHSPWGWIVQSGYYGLLSMIVATAVTEVLSPTLDPNTGEPFGWVTMGLGIALLFGVPAMVLHRLGLAHHERVFARRAQAAATGAAPLERAA